MKDYSMIWRGASIRSRHPRIVVALFKVPTWTPLLEKLKCGKYTLRRMLKKRYANLLRSDLSFSTPS
jgi:hypothetical protein